MRGLLSLLKQTRLRRGPPEGRAGRLLVRALLVETEALAVNFEETFSRFPVLTLSSHTFTEGARVQLTFARIANSMEDAISFGR